jgi:cysteinyl-tRNA synthetase
LFPRKPEDGVTLKIYNTLTGTVDRLIPGGIEKEKIEDYPPVTIYSCGPTVYSYAHIGNFRTFVFNDFLRRYLKFRGFRVDHAMNITDVDDKTIAGAREEKISLREYTVKYTDIFMEDCNALNIEQAEHIPRATDSIDAMSDIISKLDEKGIVYEKDGSLYFSISKFDEYGKLSRLDKREIKTGLRYDTDEYEKDDIRDFALWKAESDEDVSWEIPEGRGRPGWHIECSAMVRQIFGTTIDIHTGGVDLIFPHHENEIAQSEAAYGEQFVRHWIHIEHLLVDGAKMSKSKGNFYTLRDLFRRGHSARSIRYLLLSAHYKKQLNFTLQGLEQADHALSRIDNLLVRLRDNRSKAEDNPELEKIIEEFNRKFVETVDNDLNISGGLGVLFDFVHSINSLISDDSLPVNDSSRIIDLLKKIDTVFGFIFFPEKEAEEVDEKRIEELIRERLEAKKEKNFARADEIRETLLDEGIVLEDTKDGTRWIKKK